MTLFVYNSVKGEPADSPDAGTYSVMELHREHLQRYVFQTSQGAIILRRINELRVQISMHDMTALGVIVAPCLADMDEFESLYSSLTEDEQMTLDIIVQELGRIRDPREVDGMPEIIAQQCGVRLMTETELEMMTVSQYAYQISRIAAEREAVARREREIEAAMGIQRVG